MMSDLFRDQLHQDSLCLFIIAIINVTRHIKAIRYPESSMDSSSSSSTYTTYLTQFHDMVQ